MLRFNKKLFLLLVSLFACFNSVNAAAVTVFVSTPPPAAKDVVAPPYGYEGCYTVPGGYFNGVWINTHRVCQYPSSPTGDAWVAGYWQCVNYSYDHCRRWLWEPSHWVRPGVIEYGVQWGGGRFHHHHHGYYNNGYYYDRWH